MNNININSYKSICLKSVSSTQIFAKDLAENGGKHKTIIIAKYQTQSYGRMNRQWFSPEGGVWFSLILRPDIEPEKVPQITLVSSVAVCRALQKYCGLNPLIKWPNDIYIQNKKLAGILIEMSVKKEKVDWIVVGIGLNANNKIPLKLTEEAVSLCSVINKKVNCNALIKQIVFNFDELYEKFCLTGFNDLEEEYNNFSLLSGKNINVSVNNEIYSGNVFKIDKEGYLWLKINNGSLVKIIAGDVTLLKNKKL